jgi:PTS system nitrogen regulatory IIA component
MPMGALELRVDRFLPADALEVATLPLPFAKEKAASAKRRAARVRLTVDGVAEEFWLAGLPIQPAQASLGPPGPTERRTVEGRSRTVSVMLVPDAVDIGFDVKLDNFERRLDPGTSQASHFSSVVEFLNAREDLGSTALGAGVAIPHGRVKGLKLPSAAFIRLKNPIEFAAPDGDPVSILIFLLVPEKATQQHLEILSSIAQLLSDAEARQFLASANDPVKVCELLQQWGTTK